MIAVTVARMNANDMRVNGWPCDSVRSVFAVVGSGRKHEDVVESSIFDGVVYNLVFASESERHDNNVNFPLVYSVPYCLYDKIRDSLAIVEKALTSAIFCVDFST